MRTFLLTLFCLFLFSLSAQRAASVSGRLVDGDDTGIIYANVALHRAADSSLVKVEVTDDVGTFKLVELPADNYFLRATYVGFAELAVPTFTLAGGQQLDLGQLTMNDSGVELSEATVTARRALVEIKPDRTVFNVEGTINSAGSDGLALLRQAPGVTVDNNDNLTVLGRSGVLIYVDGKRLPLGGADLSNYLKSLPAEQIDRIDIITNPGAKYEAQGNAGIIDIRLKRNENEGANATVSTTVSQGRYLRYNGSVLANYRNKNMNVFGNVGYNYGDNFNFMYFQNFQNGLLLDESNIFRGTNRTPSLRLGTDFFLGKNQTVGFLVSGQTTDGDINSRSMTDIYGTGDITTTPDSLLRAANVGTSQRNQQTYNLNYRFDPGKGRSLNVDLDYGRFRNDELRDQPNRYFAADGETLLSTADNYFDTPVDIDIYTAKTDYEQPIGKGQFGAGLKYSRVETGNTFLFYDVTNEVRTLSDTRSNQFDYEENVYAAYLSYAGQLTEKISYSAGLRTELTDAVGQLTPFRRDLREDPVNLDYISFFPSAGVTYAVKQGNTVALNYGRRINRPDYNVLNPFRNQLSQLSYERGNPFLSPEIVDNVELGYTLKYRYNFKLAYSRTSNQITRLIGPDEVDPRAGFISWDNLATQTVYNFNAALPFQVTEGWNAFFNVNAGYTDNQADYGDGATIDVQVFSYSVFMQQTFPLPFDLTGEVSGYYSGPGVWGGVFEYEDQGALNLGLQRKFFDDRMNVKLSANDIFFTSGWRGVSNFNGLRGVGNGNWDSRRVALSISYAVGNSKVKSRNRKTGLEDESKRVGG
ncbi:MAG: TonB-dependent receptor [Saprospiraceae bacterium]